MEKWMKNLPNWQKLSVPSYDPMAFARMKADHVNAIPGTLTGYDCPQCRNRGHIARVREDASLVFGECSCMDIRRCVWAMEHSGLRDVMTRFRFSNFQAGEPWQQVMLDRARAYGEDPVGWLLLCGQSGCGKTHLCVAACRALLLRGMQVVYLSWASESPELKGPTNDPDARARRLRELKGAQVLYIDDLFKGGAAPTAADVRLAFDILGQRYLDGRPTLISTEYGPDELVRIDEATGGRILEMARGRMVCVQRSRERNYRLRSE